MALEIQAKKMQEYHFTHYYTALEILKYAQGQQFSREREKFINYLSENIPVFLKEKYNTGLRVTETDKLGLKLKALQT